MSWFWRNPNKAVANGLEWAFLRIKYASLLECLITDGFNSTPEILSADERQQLMRCISRRRSGESLSKKDFPEFHNERALKRIERWISNIGRDDLGLMPEDRNHIIPASFLCPDETKPKIKSTFRALGYPDDMEHELKLREFARQFGLARFGQLTSYAIGPCIVILNGDVALEDLALVPRILTMFFYDGSLGMVSFPEIGLAIVPKGADAIAGVKIADKIDLGLMEEMLSNSGWKTNVMRIKNVL